LTLITAAEISVAVLRLSVDCFCTPYLSKTPIRNNRMGLDLEIMVTRTTITEPFRKTIRQHSEEILPGEHEQTQQKEQNPQNKAVTHMWEHQNFQISKTRDPQIIPRKQNYGTKMTPSPSELLERPPSPFQPNDRNRILETQHK
jgi:hypothetical protein